MRKLTTEEFIKKSREVHGDKYDYSKVEYKSVRDKVCIICPDHSEFYQKAGSHLDGRGCPKCNGTTRLTIEEFIERAKRIHGDKYDYSKVDYKNSTTKVYIICKEGGHGEFYQTVSSHVVIYKVLVVINVVEKLG